MQEKHDCMRFKAMSSMSIDAEEWFHILKSPVVPDIKQWSCLDSHIERDIEKVLTVLESYSVKVTFFWLGWLAQRHPHLVRMCQDAGHEIANHGFAHILPNEVSRKVFQQDVNSGKYILEDITGVEIKGYRAPGFSITEDTKWIFDVVIESGHTYDSSVFPTSHPYGGLRSSPLCPHFRETKNGPLLEIPMSLIEVLGKRLNMFGGGYLRITPKWLIKWGIDKLHASNRPLLVYIHPRELENNHPHLPLTLVRKFKCYINLKSTIPKLKWLYQNYSFCTMHELAEYYVKSFYYDKGKGIPVVTQQGEYLHVKPLPLYEQGFSHHKSRHCRIISPDEGGVTKEKIESASKGI